jgi:putative flippase GtrA
LKENGKKEFPPVDDASRTRVSWVAIFVALIGSATLLILWRQMSEARTPVHKTQTQGGLKQKIRNLDKRYGIFKAVKFGLASASGFLTTELILLLGLLLMYGNLSVSGAAYSSPTLLELNIIASGIGIATAFFINERITVHIQDNQNGKGRKQFIVRLLIFEALNGAGSAIGIVVQLLLLKTLLVSPALGNIVGAIIAYPIMYLVSMRFVWKTNTAKPR